MGSLGNKSSTTNTPLYTENANELGGRPGEYTVFRSGDLSGPNGMLFFAGKESEAEFYGRMDRDLDVYKLQVNNPLVITADSDREAVMKAWAALHPDKPPRKLTTEKSWTSMDKQNSVALKKSNYDAIIYKISDEVKEIQIPKEWSNRLNKVTTKEHLGTATRKATLDNVRKIASNYSGSSLEGLAKAIEDHYAKDKSYSAKYIPWINTVVLKKKGSTGIEESRSSIYYRFTQATNGKWFARATSGEEW